MIRIGTVKWFGGMNKKTGRQNDYGFLSSNGQDVFFHRSGLGCDDGEIDEGVVVSFEEEASKERLKASRVTPISSTSVPEVFEACLASSSFEHWNLGLPWLLKSRPPIGVAQYLAPRVAELSEWVAAKVIKQIPDQMLLESAEVRALVPAELRISLLSRLLLNVIDNGLKSEFLLAVIEAAGTSEHKWRQVPIALLAHQEFYEKAPFSCKLEFLLAGVQNEDSATKRSTRMKLVDEFSQLPEEIARQHLRYLPRTLREEESIFKLLEPAEQAEIFIEAPLLNVHWQWLRPEAKYLVLFASVKLSRSIPPDAVSDGDPVISALAKMAVADKRERQTLLMQVHEAIQDQVVARAWSSADLGVAPLLPYCRQRVVEFCEGRAWHQQGDDRSKPALRAYCPRRNLPCQHDTIEKSYYLTSEDEDVCPIMI